MPVLRCHPESWTWGKLVPFVSGKKAWIVSELRLGPGLMVEGLCMSVKPSSGTGTAN